MVVLSPHLDDAVLSVWSVIAGSGEAVVVNVFAAVPGAGRATRWDRLAGATDSRSLVLRRLGEDREALALAGRVPVNLPFLDQQYRDADPDPREIAAALSERAAEASALLAPAALGAHRDHVLVRDLAVEIGRRTGVALLLYADLPYAVRRGWPSWVTGAIGDPHLHPEVDWEDALDRVPPGRQTLTARVRRLDDGQAEGKLRAMKRYRTQFPLLNGGPIGLLEHPQVLPFEVEWAVGEDGPQAGHLGLPLVLDHAPGG